MGCLAFFFDGEADDVFDIFTVIEFTSCIGLPHLARAAAPRLAERGMYELVTFELFGLKLSVVALFHCIEKVGSCVHFAIVLNLFVAFDFYNLAIFEFEPVGGVF